MMSKECVSILCFFWLATNNGQCADWVPVNRLVEIRCPFRANSKEDERIRKLSRDANSPEDWTRAYKELSSKLSPAPNFNSIELGFFGLSPEQVRKLSEQYKNTNGEGASISEDAKYFCLACDRHSATTWELQYTDGTVTKIKPSEHACGNTVFGTWLTRDQYLWREVFNCDKALAAASAAKSLRKEAAIYVRGFLCKTDNSDYNSILLERAALLNLLGEDDLALDDLMQLLNSLQEDPDQIIDDLMSRENRRGAP